MFNHDWEVRLSRYGYGSDLSCLLAKYAEQLEVMGLPLEDPDFVELLYAYFFNVEDAILITLRSSRRTAINNPTVYFTAVLRSGNRFRCDRA